MEGEVLEVPQFISSIHKSTKQLGFSFACDGLKVGNDLQFSKNFPLPVYFICNLALVLPVML